MAKNEVTVTEEKNEIVSADAMHVDISADDMMVPFLKVIQSLSEEVMAGKDKYNPDVRPGDIYDSTTRLIFTNSKVVICGLKKYYSEWTPEVRGTLVAKHLMTSPVIKNAVKVEKISDRGKPYYTLKTKDGNDLVETYGVVMIVKTDDGLTLPAVLTLSKTSYIVGKQLSTLLAIRQSKGVPVFSLTTSAVSNSKGSWYKPVFTFDHYEIDASVAATANAMAEMVDKILMREEDTAGDSVSAEESIEDIAADDLI